MNPPPCSACRSTLTYALEALWACPDCGHEWSAKGEEENNASLPQLVVVDVNGTPLQDGDSVTVIKDLRVKGASNALKVGTKVRGIRLVEGDHNIDCKIEGFGAMKLKSEFVRKA